MRLLLGAAAVVASAVAGAAFAQAPASSRSVEAWREDIAVTRDQFLAKDKSFSPEAKAEAQRRLDRLSAEAGALAEPQIVAELARVAALADNAHTRAYLLRNRGWWRRYPVRIWRFSDGWRVIAVRPGEEALLSARITRIGGKPVEQAHESTRTLFAGVPAWADYMSAYSLTSPDALLGTGVIAGDGAALFEFEKGGRRIRRTLSPADEAPRQAPEEAWWFLSPAHSATRGWAHVLDARSLPAYLLRPEAHYDARRCAGGVLYIPFFRAENQPGGETLANFGNRVLGEIERSPPRRIVVDLRFNTGGDYSKADAFFRGLATTPQAQREGNLIVVLGRATFSAAIHPAARLKQESRARFVGEGPGDRMRFWAEGGNVLLPNSRINMHYADKAHLYAAEDQDAPTALVHARLQAPPLRLDRRTPLSFRDYLAGRDPATQAVAAGGLTC
jgi:hypothetical protein